MKYINYDMIKELIEKNKTNSCFISREITDEDMKKKLLSLYLNSELDSLSINGSIFKYDFVSFEVIEYQTITGSSVTNHIIIFNDNKNNPLFTVSQNRKVKDDNGIISEQYKIYNKNSRICFSMNIINRIINNSVVQSLIDLKEKSQHQPNQYLYKSYNFLYNDNQCVMFGLDGDFKIIGEEAFINRIEIANSYIQKMGVIFESYVKSSLGLESEAKTYQIKRKVRK